MVNINLSLDLTDATKLEDFIYLFNHPESNKNADMALEKIREKLEEAICKAKETSWKLQ